MIRNPPCYKEKDRSEFGTGKKFFFLQKKKKKNFPRGEKIIFFSPKKKKKILPQAHKIIWLAHKKKKIVQSLGLGDAEWCVGGVRMCCTEGL